MPKYEIMLMTNPTLEDDKPKNLVQETFKNALTKFEKMERTSLAYTINNSTTAKYFLVNVSSEPQNISEFVRKANLNKDIWRFLVVNLDEEKATKEPKAMPKFKSRSLSSGNEKKRDHPRGFKTERVGLEAAKSVVPEKPKEKEI